MQLRRDHDPVRMIQKKICLVGALAVGKTSLVSRFVRSMFAERYLSTVGVKIDRKLVRYGDDDVSLVIWDLAGEDAFEQVRMQYLRGSSGFIVVIDGTRPNTLDTAMRIQQRIDEAYGASPFVVAANKSDLADEWTLRANSLTGLGGQSWSGIECSALNGSGVETVFRTLTERIMEP